MKKLLLVLFLAMAVVIGFGSWSIPAQAATVTFALKAQWNLNAEPDVGGYHLWFKEGAFWVKYNPTANPPADPFGSTCPLYLIPQGTNLVLFNKPVSDTPPTGVLTFGLEAVDNANNVSAKTETTYTYNTDVTPPLAPTGFTVTKQ